MAMMTDPDCIFCKILAGELPATIVDEDERTVSFMDINPATRGHALVVPRAPRAGSAEHRSRGPVRDGGGGAASGGADERAAGGRLGSTCINSCGAAAWQTVFHFHMHVIPRYVGDPLRLPWIPTRGTQEIAAAAQELGRAIANRYIPAFGVFNARHAATSSRRDAH